jgi:CheY-like chemotaxis protein
VTSAGVNRGTTVTVELPLYACDMFSRKENSLLRSAKLEPEFVEVGVFQGCFHHEVGGVAAAPHTELSSAVVVEISASHSVLQNAATATADMHSLIDGGKESDDAAGAEAGSPFRRQPSSGSGAGSGLGLPVVRQSSRGPGASGTPFVRQTSQNSQVDSRGGSRGSSRGGSKGEDAVRPAESVENSSRSQSSAGSHSGKRSVVGDLDDLGCSLAALSMKHKQLRHAFDSSSSDENVAPTYDPRYKRHHKKHQDKGITLTGPSSSAKSISSVTSASGFTGHSTSMASDFAKPSYFSQMVGSMTAAMSGKSEAVDPHSSHSGSENSVGSSGFSVTSTSAATSSTHAAAGGGQDLSELNIRRVLVVDDVESNRKMLVRLLQRKGIKHCTQAEDGQKAVDAYMTSSTSSRSDLDTVRGGSSAASASTGRTTDSFQPFDCILMDSEMPVMSGPNAAKMLRSLGCTVPIVGVSGNVLPADVANFVAHGANAVLPKPMNFDALFGLLSDLHNQKQRTQKLK